MKNSELSIHPMYQKGHPCNGLTKIEYTTIKFVASHLAAHGKYPDHSQLQALTDLAIWLLDVAIPENLASTYPNVNPQDVIDDLEIDQPNSPLSRSTFTEE